MASTITNAFITQFEAEVHMAYQRMGAKLKSLVRTVNGVNGSTVKFQKLAKGTATTKARHAEVVAMNSVHSNVTATLADYYAADYIDKLDELKVNIDERGVLARNAAYALGRKTDAVIVAVLDAATSIAANINSSATGMPLIKEQNMLMELIKRLELLQKHQVNVVLCGGLFLLQKLVKALQVYMKN